MLAPFYSTTKRAIAPIVKPLGFRCQGRFYYRIVGNVVQQFCLLWLNRDFTIRFHLSSVFGDNDKTIEGEEVTKLINGSNNMWLKKLMATSELPYQSYVQECANTCVDVLTNYLLPWFDSSNNSSSAYKMAKEADIYLTMHQEPDSYGCLGFLLDMGRWEQSATLVKYYLDNSLLYNQYWWKTREQEYRQLYDALISGDALYIKQYMDEKKSKHISSSDTNTEIPSNLS